MIVCIARISYDSGNYDILRFAPLPDETLEATIRRALDSIKIANWASYGGNGQLEVMVISENDKRAVKLESA